ncbi:unnamed protein product (plasmid) [Mycetohabitans rhizoxinica HKI 454]|uniref:Uncharacterized protein n=1 Tax=Mycetohabitans rhizoxinica (strain DSM 19002 / CIP 109453 / HKI 454) TaxID=882378 RepID=E5AU58_MYCRK|nr:unnamed protein product [Mycetohabitans rhizoxinica HKI 454]
MLLLGDGPPRAGIGAGSGYVKVARATSVAAWASIAPRSPAHFACLLSGVHLTDECAARQSLRTRLAVEAYLSMRCRAPKTASSNGSRCCGRLDDAKRAVPRHGRGPRRR